MDYQLAVHNGQSCECAEVVLQVSCDGRLCLCEYHHHSHCCEVSCDGRLCLCEYHHHSHCCEVTCQGFELPV